MTTLWPEGPVIHPLCLGGNVFGWTADEKESFEVLDAYVDGGGNFIDTADVYSKWVPGHTGGESETVIGEWLAKRRRRDDVLIATKVGRNDGIARKTILAAFDKSLKRLQTDYVDLLYTHADDNATPPEETLATLSELVQAGKARAIAASNYGPARLAECMETSDRLGLSRYVALQTHYNLLERSEYESELEPVCREHGIGCMPYSALAAGFLTGKYRAGGSEKSKRSDVGLDGSAYLDSRGIAVLEVLDDLSVGYNVPIASLALAWLMAKPTVIAVSASARTVSQLEQLMPVATTQLTREDILRLDAAGN